ncbi:MAG: RNA polymerase sigma factor [Candidatus Omnitrophica bacterium]|nr:RNA polymerase sigma factor [Candidatus Omnitrophota bacterium]
MNDISDDTLIAASQGNAEAFEAVYKAASGLVYNVALRIVNNREDAQEVTQEVFLIVYDKLKTFRFESSFKTWVYRITANYAINWAKKESRIRRKTVEYDDTQMSGAPQEEPEDEESKVQNVQAAQKLLDALPPDQRACVVLRNLEGLSYQEIADTLKININTVRSRLNRAREKLLTLQKKVVV